MSIEHRAVILFAHGSRDPLWRWPVEAVALRMRAIEPNVLVACAYLELIEPDLPAAALALLDAGALRISVVPLFLGVGRHAREDLPRLVQTLALAHTHVQFKLQPAIGEDPRVVDLLAEIALE